MIAKVIPLPAASALSEANCVTAEIHGSGELVGNWQTALQFLKDGNSRYLGNRTIIRDNAKDREILKDGQKPFAVVITCSDSRVPPEIYFDQKLGDIFVIRNAGNIADPTALGSIEYAVEHLKAPLVVVVGHSCCGAVTGAFNGGGEHPENLKTILDEISPVVKNCGNIGDAIRANIDHVVKRIKENKTVKNMRVTVVGAYYNIESGEVSFAV